MVGRFGEPRRARQTLEQSKEAYRNGYREEKLEEGRRFQDVVTRALYQRGIVVVGYASRHFQQKCGENLLGAEIKRDGYFRRTGNLYIETHEKAVPDKPFFAKAGILRGDNSWLFVIGDEATVWIFSTKYLLLLKSRYQCVETPTSRGFLLPLAEADKYCIRKIDLEEEHCNGLSPVRERVRKDSE